MTTTEIEKLFSGLKIATNEHSVVERFRAPAAFYRPSDTKGEGWVATAAPDKGGSAVIQLLRYPDHDIAVVRFINFIGKDGLNARILPGLPILLEGKRVYFKSSSCTTCLERRNTSFCIKFAKNFDAVKFALVWGEMNGTVKLPCDPTSRVCGKKKKRCFDAAPTAKKLCSDPGADADFNGKGHSICYVDPLPAVQTQDWKMAFAAA